MSKSYAFVGTSYLAQCELDYTTDEFETPEDSWRHIYQTNIVRELSKKHPDNTIYNCSEDGYGIELYHKRVLTLIDRYEPDVFVLEIPTGERYTLHTNNDYYQDYSLYFPVQEYKAGITQNLKEKSSPLRPGLLDSYQATLSPEELNNWWERHTGDQWLLSEKQWRGYKQVLTHTNNAIMSRQADVIAQAEMITSYLKHKGKKVYWFYWLTVNHFDTLHLALPLLDDRCMLQWAYEKHTGRTNTKFDSPNPTDDLEHWTSHFDTLSWDKRMHLHSKNMASASEYFDKIFK